MHDFTIWNTWYMNVLIEANNKILLVGTILHDKLNSDNFKRLLCMLQNLNEEATFEKKLYMQTFSVSEVAAKKDSIPNTSP